MISQFDSIVCHGRDVSITFAEGQDSGDLIAFGKMCDAAFPDCTVTLRSGKRILAIYPSIQPEPL